MNSRERVLSAIGHKEPDRTPIDLGATPSSGISVVAYANLVKHLKIDIPTYAYDVIQEVAQPDNKVLDMFNVDIIDLGRFFNQYDDYWHELELISGYKALYPKWFNPKLVEDGSWLGFNNMGDAVGRMPKGATFFDQTIYPYLDGYPSNYKNLAQDMSKAVWGGLGITPWDSNTGSDFWQNMRDKAIEVRAKTDRALILGIGCNLFEWGCFLRRMDNFMMDMFISPKDVHNMLDALLELHMSNLQKTCEAVGDVVDIIKFGDDLGMNSGPLMATDTYKEFFKARHKKMCDYVKSNSKMVPFLHSCGSIHSLLPDLIDAGFEIINPVQINALNMEPERLKREFGNDITFYGGGVDTQGVLNIGTIQQVKDQVKRNLEIFSKGGGYIFNTVHNIMPDVPPQNIVAMFEAVRDFGK